MLKYIVQLAACLLFGLVGPAAAQTFYIAPPGASAVATPDGSLAKPFPSLSAAFKSGKVDGGETLLLMDGKYGSVKLYNIAMASPVIIRSQNGKKAHMDSVVMTGTTKNLILQNLSVWPSSPDLIVRELVVTAATTSLITIEGLLMYSHPDAPNYLKWSETDWNGRKVNGIRLNGSNSTARGNTLVATYSGLTSTGANNRFEKNTVDGFNGDGMRGLGPNNVFLRNLVKKCVATDENHDDGFQAWVNSTSNPTGLVLDGNIILEWAATPTNHPLRCRLQGIGLFDGIYRNLTIINNVVSATQYHGISVYGADNAIIANNTVVHSTGNPTTSPYIMVVATKRGIEPTNVLIANNVAMSIRGTPSVERNVVFKNNSVLTYPAKMLMDVLTFDYRPKADSGLIDTGELGSAPKVDIVGVARPQGAGADRGAYEGAGAVAPVSPKKTLNPNVHVSPKRIMKSGP